MVGAVGVAEERVVALTIVGKDESRWKWWLLLLLLVLRSRWQRIRFLHRGEREREVLRPPREVVRRLLVVNIMVDKTVVGVVVVEGHDVERKKEEKAVGNQKPGEKMIFS